MECLCFCVPCAFLILLSVVASIFFLLSYFVKSLVDCFTSRCFAMSCVLPYFVVQLFFWSLELIYARLPSIWIN